MAQPLRFDRRIQFQRSAEGDDGLAMVESWADHGGRTWAARRDVSDAERVAAGWVEATAAGWVEATVASRFTVRSTAFSRGLTARDRLICDGRVFGIIGIKELGNRGLLEITCTARADLG